MMGGAGTVPAIHPSGSAVPVPPRMRVSPALDRILESASTPAGSVPAPPMPPPPPTRVMAPSRAVVLSLWVGDFLLLLMAGFVLWRLPFSAAYWLEWGLGLAGLCAGAWMACVAAGLRREPAPRPAPVRLLHSSPPGSLFLSQRGAARSGSLVSTRQ